MTTLKISHSYGFFSCSSIRLHMIVDYLQQNKNLPDIIDSSEQYNMYKHNHDKDITFDFFEEYTNFPNIEYSPHEFIDFTELFRKNYKSIDYDYLSQFVKKYFSPSQEIKETINNLVEKYNIDYKKTIVVYYRATDKVGETKIDTFENMYNKLIEVTNSIDTTDLQLLIQTDSGSFLDYLNDKMRSYNINMGKNIIISSIKENSVSYTDRGIHNEKSSSENYYDMKQLLSTIHILSKCNHLIVNSSNVSLWILLYRGNIENVYQNLELEWV